MKNTLKLVFVIALGLFDFNVDAQTPADDIVVIVNTSNSLNTMSRNELRAVFQTTKLQWGDGLRIEAFQLPETDPTRRGFDAAVLGLDPDRVARFWTDRKIRGGERPPSKLATANAMLRTVASNPNSIGYVNASAATAKVKVIAKIHNGLVSAP